MHLSTHLKLFKYEAIRKCKKNEDLLNKMKRFELKFSFYKENCLAAYLLTILKVNMSLSKYNKLPSSRAVKVST
jgi:hypothetical protein